MKITRRKIAIGLFVLVVLGLLGVLAVVLPYRPIPIAGPVIAPTPLTLSEAVPGLRLHVFNTGENRMSSLLVGASPPWRAVPAFVIEHPTRGLVVFDLGLSHEVAQHGERAIDPPIGWLMESRGRPGLTLEAQMNEAGLATRDVRYVVISHLHEDHTGVADEFAQAVFIGGPGTQKRVTTGGESPFHAGHAGPAPEWREVSPQVGTKAEARAGAIGPFERGLDLFGDGSIDLIPAGGHTPEELMALVNLESGPVLLAGDAAVHFDWLESDDVERIASDPERAADTRNRLRSLRDSNEILIIPGHDLRQLGRPRPDLILHHPERFVPSAWPIGDD